jgi:hypothetical protein
MGMLGAIGTAIGAAFGGPTGAAVGGAIGSGIEGKKESSNAPVTTTEKKDADLPWGTIGDLAGSAIQGGLGYFGTQQTNAANAQQAQLNRDFQAGQTGTAYQRAVADMKAAGLSPMLAYSQGGASSGSGSTAVMQDKLGALSTGAKSGLMLKQQLDAQRLDNFNRIATGELTAQQAKTSSAQEEAFRAQVGVSNAQKARLDAEQAEKDRVAEVWRSKGGRAAAIGQVIKGNTPGAKVGPFEFGIK